MRYTLHRKRTASRIPYLLAAVLLLDGCATASNPQDPFEPFNRGVYQFNADVDKAILKPVAQGYRAVLPKFMQTGVKNFFSNVSDVPVALNNALQGKLTAAFSDIGRVAINSTVGVLGLFDIASKAGLEKHREDFGQTLGKWGVGGGPFLMLPIFGPSNGRDLAGFVVDFATDPITRVNPSSAVFELSATRLVNRRAELLDTGTLLQNAALDEYQFMRDGYLQHRRHQIYDGNPPPDDDSIAPSQQDNVVPKR